MANTDWKELQPGSPELDYLEWLTPKQRRAVELAVTQGLDGAQVAAEMGVSPASAYKILNRAEERLAEVMEQEGAHA